MSGRTSYRRNPAIHCWIKHIKESYYNEEEKMFYTIFGQTKRIRILGTIIEKDEQLLEINEEDFGFNDDRSENLRIRYVLDDGTGIIRAIIDKIDPQKFDEFGKGDIVDVIGTISKRAENIMFWIEIINKVDEANYILLRDAEIINRIKSGDIQKIPVISERNKIKHEISKEIDVNDLFEEKVNNTERSIKDRVFSIIKNSDSGISFQKLSKEIKIPDIELRTYINDLILESLIFESDEDFFESF